MEQIVASVHAMTEAWTEEHRGRGLTEVAALGQKARAETLALPSELSHEQLASKLPCAPWADGTIGGVLATNADHGRMHRLWREGWDDAAGDDGAAVGVTACGQVSTRSLPATNSTAPGMRT